jgi:hypothetical protein
VKVPWVDEIREARAQLEKGRLAALDLEQVMVALARAQAGQVEPDYEAWYTQLALRWKLTTPALPAIPAMMNARTAMAAASGGVSRANARLQSLRAQQREALSGPEFAELLPELDSLQKQSNDLAMERILPNQRRILLGSGATLVAEALALLDSERAANAARPLRSCARLYGLRELLPTLMSTVQLELELPQGPPSPQLDWAELEPWEQAYRELVETMRALETHWGERVALLQAEYERVSSDLFARFG